MCTNYVQFPDTITSKHFFDNLCNGREECLKVAESNC